MAKKLGELSSPGGSNVFRVYRRPIFGEIISAVNSVTALLPSVIISEKAVNSAPQVINGRRYPAGTVISFRATSNSELIDTQCGIKIKYTATGGITETIGGLYILVNDVVSA